ncbi:hypothetical protein [Elioraea thermophila]|uniref:hypothetical protein n=1 Tax=Elioraea thermophila TaxID=2185104 RepID=UPI000DF2C5E9|nr:hypothetical protein [Elioraea thermophila]
MAEAFDLGAFVQGIVVAALRIAGVAAALALLVAALASLTPLLALAWASALPFALFGLAV